MLNLAQVTDTNGRIAGTRRIVVSLRHDGTVFAAEYKDQQYDATGKVGNNFKTGEQVFEVATDSDQRLWVNADGSKVWED